MISVKVRIAREVDHPSLHAALGVQARVDLPRLLPGIATVELRADLTQREAEQLVADAFAAAEDPRPGDPNLLQRAMIKAARDKALTAEEVAALDAAESR